MKRVLIALDYNPTAQKVAEAGFELATAMGAETILLHVVSDPVYYAVPEYSPVMGFMGFMETSQIQLDSADGLKKASQFFLDKSKKHLGDIAIKTMVREGDFASTIIKAAREAHASVIVMGSHSQKWLENIVMGSVTEKVMNHTTVPLFIIPTKKRS